MKLSPPITPRGGLRLVPVTVMVCFVILADVLATDETLEGQRRFEDQNSIRTSADNVEPNKVGQSLFNRVRRALKNNTSTTHNDFERRLKTMEERLNKSASLTDQRLQEIEKRLDVLLRLSPKASDSYGALLVYLLGQRGQYAGKERMGPPGPPGPAGNPGSKGEAGAKGSDVAGDAIVLRAGFIGKSQLKDHLRVRRGFRSYFYNYLDEIAMATCAAIPSNGPGLIYAVRRTCGEKDDCKHICTDPKLRQQGPKEVQDLTWDCMESIHVYKRQPALADNYDEYTDSHKLGLAVFRHHSCCVSKCGPNYCCCRAVAL